MKKKWIAVGMLAVIVMIGAASNVTEARAKSCQIEGCIQIGEHEHYNCGVEGCEQTGKHEHTHNQKESHHAKHGNKGHH